jgi:dTDP-4-amino-4,6-dideoxygalactose transaminase
MTWRIPLAAIEMGEAERQAADRVLRSGWLSMGSETEALERALAARVGVRHAFAVTNATAALHLALAALGIKAGDEVAVPSLTFVASANVILYTGADPVFVDIEGPDDLTISVSDLERKLTPRTRAVIVVHYAGYVCDMAAILQVARRHGLAVVEDAAHALGAQRDGLHAGAFGDVGCFSFYANKNLTTGEGGALVTNRDDVAERIRLMRSHGMTTLTWDRWKGHAHSYDVVELGYNYRFDDLRAAIGRVQLEQLDPMNDRRRQLVERYHRQLRDVPGVTVPFARHPGTSAYHILPVLLADVATRERVIAALTAEGIQTSIHYPPIHRFAYYRRRFPNGGQALKLTEEVADRELTLPLYPSLGHDEVDVVVDGLRRALSRRA